MFTMMSIQESPKLKSISKTINEKVTNKQESDARKPCWPMIAVRTWTNDDKVKYAMQGLEWSLKEPNLVCNKHGNIV